jgi:hypothetical protein
MARNSGVYIVLRTKNLESAVTRCAIDSRRAHPPPNSDAVSAVEKIKRCTGLYKSLL